MLKPRMWSSRSGFTLVELLVVLIFMGILAAAIVNVLLRQQRFYNSTAQMIQTRQQLRQAAFMLPADLRTISPRIAPLGDIYLMSDSSIEFRSVFGSSAACVVSTVAPGYVTTVPVRLAKGSAMTNWKVPPVVNDSVAIYDDAFGIGSADDVWRFYRITAVVPQTGDVANGCPSASRLVTVPDLTATNPSYRLTLSPVPTTTTARGASMRFFRRVHYNLFKWTDGKTYLGFFDCIPNRLPAVCTAPQPIAGPLRPYAAPGTTSGFELAYYDSTGAVTTNRALVARISLVVRAQGEALINMGGASVPLRDSLRIEIGMRNRN